MSSYNTRVVVQVLPDKVALGRAAAQRAATILREAIAARGQARIVAATGASQFEFLEALTAHAGHRLEAGGAVPPRRVPGPARSRTRPAFAATCASGSSTGPASSGHHLLDGEGDVPALLRAVSQAIAAAPIDVAFVGIGENGHLAFNDPPADFATEAPYLVVELDEACRRQQVGEGWFARLDEVPTPGHLHVGAPDPARAGDPVHRARRAQGRGGAGHASPAPVDAAGAGLGAAQPPARHAVPRSRTRRRCWTPARRRA